MLNNKRCFLFRNRVIFRLLLVLLFVVTILSPVQASEWCEYSCGKSPCADNEIKLRLEESCSDGSTDDFLGKKLGDKLFELGYEMGHIENGDQLDMKVYFKPLTN